MEKVINLKNRVSKKVEQYDKIDEKYNENIEGELRRIDMKEKNGGLNGEKDFERICSIFEMIMNKNGELGI